MEPNWAGEHLQVIRTLMERSALYRRALAPVMLVCGGIGLAAAVATCFVKIEKASDFSVFWLATSVLALVAALLFVRRQALKEAEPFWSPPTRRVGQALFPPFLVGLVAGVMFVANKTLEPAVSWYLALLWTALYGCALHAAGFFMQRGIRLFAWGLILGSAAVFLAGYARPQLVTSEYAHYVMGVFFGVLHVAYGLYLYFTERSRKSA